jgi:hypothetical protein
VGAREEEAVEPREKKQRVRLRLGSSAGLKVVPRASADEVAAGSPEKGVGPTPWRREGTRWCWAVRKQVGGGGGR